MSSIPSHAIRVFKGVLFEVYQWEQVLYDGSTQTFEALKRQPGSLVIALQGDDVLYARQEQPCKPTFLSLFGGRAEPGETPLEVAQRELLEEAGLVSDHWHHLRDFEWPGKIDWTVSLFVAHACRHVGGENPDPGERIEMMRAPLHDFITRILPQDDFFVEELKREVVCGLDPVRAAALEEAIRRTRPVCSSPKEEGEK